MSQGYVRDADKLVNGCVMVAAAAAAALAPHPGTPTAGGVADLSTTYVEARAAARKALGSAAEVRSLSNVVFNVCVREHGAQLVCVLVDVVTAMLTRFVGNSPGAPALMASDAEAALGVYAALAGAVDAIDENILMHLHDYIASEAGSAVSVNSPLELDSFLNDDGTRKPHPSISPDADGSEDDVFAAVGSVPRLVNIMPLPNWVAQLFVSVALPGIDPTGLRAAVDRASADAALPAAAKLALDLLISFV
ncbi:uncharacterized protein AMSG_01645 [Thecamonas trahens ATCC 50062]|uniref:Uncharacterized protein n=1 Tax=Thecamonas trahens ATCC 50062 TaxID=461836 RepID=A0A0L0DTK0_THETB|nr:hypothetical protein AMSG_01645 [Thecamonas trahens ATCC 50062]KNC54793.1 hypothetical protein AMSG_01645 [Thecamonas trahens ATCC 50062]|eukprot:XP_013761693.1 hypothetical protein AMSG_01645 [Thecamonas trahens ATCC 50062]